MNTLSLPKAILLLQLNCFSYLLFAFIWWLAALPTLDRPAQLLLDITVWPLDGSHDQLSTDARFLSAIGAGLLVAMTLLILLIVIPELRRGNFSVLRGTTISLIAWYAIDSIGCITAGVGSNAVLNTVYVSALLVPLWLIHRAHVQQTNQNE